jgi:hypothetical protein
MQCGHETVRSHPFVAKVRNVGSYISLPHTPSQCAQGQAFIYIYNAISWPWLWITSCPFTFIRLRSWSIGTHTTGGTILSRWADNTNGKLCRNTDAGTCAASSVLHDFSYTTLVQHIFGQFRHSSHVQYTDERDFEYGCVTASKKVRMSMKGKNFSKWCHLYNSMNALNTCWIIQVFSLLTHHLLLKRMLNFFYFIILYYCYVEVGI